MWWIIVIIAVLISALVVYIILETKKFKVTKYVYYTHKVNDRGFRICVISDMHGTVYGKNNEAVLEAIDKEKPDLVILAGDMITAKEGEDFSWTIDLSPGAWNIGDGVCSSNNKSLEASINFMIKLASKYPVYMGNGNHESRLYRKQQSFGYAYNDLRKTLEAIGVTLLSDDMRIVPIKGNVLNIFGLDIAGEYYKRFERIKMPPEYIEVKLGRLKSHGVEEENLNLLIAHNPSYFENYVDWGADLSFAGHVHGGVLRIGKRGVISPQFILFPKYSGGMYEKDNKAMIVSCGLGFHSMPIRINDRAEIVIVDVKKK